MQGQNPSFFMREAGPHESAQVEISYGDYGIEYGVTQVITDLGACTEDDIQNYSGDWERALAARIFTQSRADWFAAWGRHEALLGFQLPAFQLPLHLQ